jgi:hypothetical protein
VGWRDEHAIVSTVSSALELPWRRMSVTGPSVEGDQVIVYGEPADIPDRLLMVKAFWAAARVARKLRMRAECCMVI